MMIEESDDLSTWTEVARRTGYGVGSLWTGTSGTNVTESGTPEKTVIVPGSQYFTERNTTHLRLQLAYVPPIIGDS